jgi:hypothetical protein
MSHAVILVAVECAEDEVEEAVAEQMEPFDENGKWFRNGSRWDWYQIGGRWSGYFAGEDIVRVGDIGQERFEAAKRRKARETYEAAVKEQAEMSSETLRLIYGFDPGIVSKEAFVESKMKCGWFPTAHAFLANRRWNEGGRMGWFGCNTATECEVKGKGKNKVRRCLTIADRKSGARVITWNEDGETWNSKFYKRFISKLGPKTFLVAVDYHV